MRATSTASDRPLASGLAPVPRRLRVLVGAAAVMAALSFLFGAEAPGAGIRGDLAAGAETLEAMPETASDAAVRQAMRKAFPGRSISVDTARYPALVAVTIRDVDQRNCIAAARTARRLEGRVVVELEGYGSPGECGAGNSMTWRFMP